MNVPVRRVSESRIPTLSLAGIRIWTLFKFAIGVSLDMVVGFIPTDLIVWLRDWGEYNAPKDERDVRNHGRRRSRPMS